MTTGRINQVAIFPNACFKTTLSLDSAAQNGHYYKLKTTTNRFVPSHAVVKADKESTCSSGKDRNSIRAQTPKLASCPSPT
jgi:hypothetical protein